MSTNEIPRLNYGVKLTRRRMYFFVVRKDVLRGRLDKLVEERLVHLENEFAEMKQIKWLGPHSERKAKWSQGNVSCWRLEVWRTANVEPSGGLDGRSGAAQEDHGEEKGVSH